MNNDTAVNTAIKPKQRFSGKVLKTNIAGAIIDIGSELPGVIHISQIQKNPVNKVEDVLKAGQTVDVWVRRVKNDRIELTMIQPLEYEWKDLKPEMIVKGKVVRLEAYGAFVDFGAERPGMVHVSELTHGYVKTPGDVVKVDDEVEAMIIDVDRKKKQIRLSMKALIQQPEEAPSEPAQPEKKQKNKRSKASRQETETNTEPPAPPEPTAFELAWQEALEKQSIKKGAKKDKKVKSNNKQQDDILSRTLQDRLPTGG